jgi:hypothetical protein
MPLPFVVFFRAERPLAVLAAGHVRHVQPVVHKFHGAADALAGSQYDAVLLLAICARAARPVAWPGCFQLTPRCKIRRAHLDCHCNSGVNRQF